MAKKLAALGLLAVVVLAGCQRAKQMDFAVTFVLPVHSVPESILLADGREVARTRQERLQLTLPGRPGRDYGPEMLPKLSARVLYPCGWRDVEVKVMELISPGELEYHHKAGRPMPLTANVQLPQPNVPEVTLWVDNRDHAEARLAVGQQERVIPANSKDKYDFGWEPSCPGALEVRLDGKKVGELSAEIRSADVGEEYSTRDVRYSSEFLVDTSGKRCYSFNEFCYAPKNKAKDCGGPIDATSYRPAGLHRLPPDPPVYFLEELPKTIQVERGMPLPEGSLNVEIRTRLQQVSCR